jgi:predicted DNA-binding transcriptional regulator YafY
MIRNQLVYIDYTNHRGETRKRTIVPQRLFFGTMEPWHVDSQWLLHALDVEINEERTFAMAGVHSWRAVDGV